MGSLSCFSSPSNYKSSLWKQVSNIQFFAKPGTANMLPMCCYCPSFHSWQILLINHGSFPAELGLGSKFFSTQPPRQALPIDQRCHSRGKHPRLTGKELQAVGFAAVWHGGKLIFSQDVFSIGLVSFSRKESFSFLSIRE